ncbi:MULTISPECIES: hypothetical protein [unclassified Streptomyces]|uniref:WXG100-like domain-containing protein n=1 Tax=unclassified Streptomyces TaxID=2593676 RepID=UPI0033E897B9
MEVLDLIGIDWPQIDEDEVKASAKDFRKLAEGIRDAVKEATMPARTSLRARARVRRSQRSTGAGGSSPHGYLSTFAKGCDTLADSLDDCAHLVLGCKIAVIAKLSATAAAAGAGVVGMFFTLGASGCCPPRRSRQLA